jgi:hypothetical protein
LKDSPRSVNLELCENRIMIAVRVQNFLDRARDFREGMNLLKDGLTEYRSSSALLGIHCANSYSDALRTGMGCIDVSSDDHQTAAKDLKSRLLSRRFEKVQGVDRLERLLAKKSRIAYASDAAREDEIKEIVLQAGRFALWAEEAGRKLGIEGW